MLKHIVIFISAFLFLAIGSEGEAFVPQTPHLLHLMVQKIKEPAGLTIYQERILPESSAAGEDVAATSVQEVLAYSFPGALRVEVNTGSRQGFYVSSDKGFVRVSHGVITARAPSPADIYTDVLLYRNHHALLQKLSGAGVTVEKVTFQRLDGRICYLIGQPPTGGAVHPGLWIEKDSFFPVRYLAKHENWLVDVRYDGWERVSRTWYPMKTLVFVNGQLFADIKVSRVELTPDFPPARFDLDRIIRQYPVQDASGQGTSGHDKAVEDLNRELNEFNQLYDE